MRGPSFASSALLLSSIALLLLLQAAPASAFRPALSSSTRTATTQQQACRRPQVRRLHGTDNQPMQQVDRSGCAERLDRPSISLHTNAVVQGTALFSASSSSSTMNEITVRPYITPTVVTTHPSIFLDGRII